MIYYAIAFTIGEAALVAATLYFAPSILAWFKAKRAAAISEEQRLRAEAKAEVTKAMKKL
jgi:preprotein translocase subunit SecF